MAQIREGNAQEKLGNPYGTADYSTFEFGNKHATTEPFGLLLPFDVKNGITGDVHKLSNTSIEKSYTLDAPLMSQVWKNKEWFLVPKMAILPNAWEKIYKQPKIGDDVDAQEVGTSIKASYWKTILTKVHGLLIKTAHKIEDYVDQTQGVTAEYLLDYLFKSLILNEYIFSYGSLLNRLGASMASIYINQYSYTFDEIFNQIITVFTGGGFRIYWEDNDDEHYMVDFGMDREYTKPNSITMREALQRMRDNLEFHIETIYPDSSSSGINVNTTTAGEIATLRTYFGIILNKLENLGILGSSATYNYSKPMNYERLLAYQFICAEYYTDDNVDYIYNDDILREYISTLVKDFADNSQSLEYYYYEYNGIKVPYDWCSAHYIKDMLTYISACEDLVNVEYKETIASRTIFTALFNLNRSLKYMDYFTGGRTRPLATNDVIVSVQSNQFKVLDLSKRTQETRFKMAVNRIGNKIDEYVEGLLGIKQAVDYHYALWIGKTTDVIHASETENTGTQQFELPYAVSSRFEGYSNQYGFEAKLDRDAILMGITYYDIERYYFRGVDRHFMHVDRFDMFNQFMQYTGDQPVYSEEYDAKLTGDNATYFSYKPAYEEFKEGINKADSGFILSLKGFIFLDDVNEKNFFNKSTRAAQHLSPDFIRSKPTELDRFYSNLGTNFSLGTYFHFIVIYNNGDNAVRPMAYNPALNI